jgi:hypothetical protein
VIPYENKNKFKIMPSEVIGAHNIASYDKRWATVKIKAADAEVLALMDVCTGTGGEKLKNKKNTKSKSSSREHIINSHVHGRSVGAGAKIEVLLFRPGTAEF